jgi:TorA maturation chaperone TorD
MDASESKKIFEPNEQLFTAYSVIFYFTGSIITIEPDNDGLPAFCSSGLLKNLPVTSMNPAFTAASDFFKAPCAHSEACAENVWEYYQKLFSDKDQSIAWPAESAWPSQMNEILVKIHGSIDDFYSKYSFLAENDRQLPPDHLGIELLFFNKLISGFLNAQDLKIKADIRKDIISFSESHLLNWLPAWVTVVKENSKTKCFKGIASLILASVEDVKSLLITGTRS